MHHCVSVSVATAADCTEHHRLLDALCEAIERLVKVQASHATVKRTTGSDTTGYEEDLVAAATRWTTARKAFEQHVMEHGC